MTDIDAPTVDRDRRGPGGAMTARTFDLARRGAAIAAAGRRLCLEAR